MTAREERIRRKLNPKMAHAECCELCGKPFLDGGNTFGGVTKTHRLAVVGACCYAELKEVFFLGFWFENSHDYKEEIRSSGISGNNKLLVQNAPDSAWQTSDREWFEANPDRSHRVRELFPGELDNLNEIQDATYNEKNLFMIVRQISPGRRSKVLIRNIEQTRFLLSLVKGHSTDEEPTLHAVYDLAVKNEQTTMRKILELARSYRNSKATKAN